MIIMNMYYDLKITFYIKSRNKYKIYFKNFLSNTHMERKLEF